MERDELAAWLRLIETPGIGNEGARRLLAAFGSPQAVFDAPAASAWRALLTPAQVAALAASHDSAAVAAQTTLAWLAAGPDRQVVPLGDPAYPDTLLQTADPPLLLYTQGRPELLQALSVAVVGSRNPTRQGLDNARSFAAHLSRQGITVVSGLALGIDGAAHEGALDGPGGTVAVLGTGLDRIYPRRHLDLAHRIAAAGLLISEYALGTPPLPANFPRRNRIISGLARGTLVVEAALASGSLITARMASEQGREVFAIPGSIHTPQSRGCHALIKQGAKLVDSAQDILEELQLPSLAVASPGARESEAAAAAGHAGASPEPSTKAGSDPLLDALGFDAITLDGLSARTGWDCATLSARLLELELAGDVARLPGQLFQRIARS
ncbi:DNA-processing protein DprA [Caldimonas brevitalea]|uniref:DNA-processing protein DprA n=1 Tax=Caldimonas brevitalea TaxID=413882 RepID=UPI00063FF1EB|nr:DNA-processing protein DprA [Caldimonas brevitalea]